jgi:16S rRNA (cytidine1402-2'-O)-methyltransferase
MPREPDDPAVAPGHLYVVATPIGNLGDLAPRARAVLAAVDRICAEDTRTSGVLLSHFGIARPLAALHEHNEDRLAAQLVKSLQDGESLALVSDAGTPLVSDPGFALVRAARAAGVPVVALPGPSAAIAALSIAGLPCDRFVFEGFLPPKAGARRARLAELASETRTLIFYESAHRIVESLQTIADVFGAERPLCLARELTKRFEQSLTASAGAIVDWIGEDADRQRGEFVLVVGGAPVTATTTSADVERVLRTLLGALPPSAAARLAAEITGARRSELYDLAVQLGGGDQKE